MMETNYRFSFQENQYTGECLPCTSEVFNRYLDDPKVAWKIDMRRAVDNAICEGLPLDEFANDKSFKRFCAKKQKDVSFTSLTLPLQLLQWTASLKMWLPCFVFGVKDFVQVTITRKDGQEVPFRRRKLEGIERLSCLFMFDGDHLTCDPREIYERTLAPGFPWKVRLAHKTSSGWGLRLVCEARAELGNIADNQICLARDLGLMGVKGSTGKPVVDDSCIDATRISYCPCRKDIYYIDENHLFNF